MYKLKEIDNKSDWNDFIIKGDFSFYTFLQSWEWGEVQQDIGKNIIRYGVYQGEELIGVSLILKVRAKRGSYFFLPHGPLILGSNTKYFEVLDFLINELKILAKAKGYDFLRLNSPVNNSLVNKESFKTLGAIDAPMHENAEDTHLLDISIPEEKLLGNMKKGDRYYINRAIKEGVEIRVGNDAEQIGNLISMHHAHSKKTNYTPFSEKFTKSLYKYFGNNITTISASYEGKIESILMTIKFGKVCVYYIAASDIVHSKFSPNYLCQWEAIKTAKANGCTIYNFWGVSPDDNPKHPIAGVTKFKRKFAGYDHSLLHAQDFPISNKYWINWGIETIRRKKRGYYYKKPV